MKEEFEDRITKRIREVMAQYEPEYPPQAWEDFRKYKHRHEFWLIRFFFKYRYWFTGIIITGILIILFRVFYPSFQREEAVVIPQDSESISYPESSRSNKVFDPERPVHLNHDDLKTNKTADKESLSFNYLSLSINDSLPAIYDNKTQIEKRIQGIPDSIGIASTRIDLMRLRGLSNQFENSLLLPSEIKALEVPDLSSHISDRKSKFKLQLPEISALTPQSNNYKRFIGPNKITMFYSQENHYSDSLKRIGISHGFGMIIEGPIRSFISISAGLSYQSLNFNKTLFSGQVPDSIPPWVILIDSIVTMSGNSKYLELPVYVNIKFLKRARSQFWFGTGISLMAFLRQNYIYETIVGEKNEKVDISADSWENIHPLASLNFNMLYRFQFSDRLFLNSSVQYKLHLEPLGYNSMKLNRLNLQVGLGYRFGRYD